MSNVVVRYLDHLKESDEKTKHRSALTIAIVLSVIVIIILFLIFKNNILQLNKAELSTEVEAAKADSSMQSPVSLFSNFFTDTGDQISKLRSNISVFFENKNKLDQINQK